MELIRGKKHKCPIGSLNSRALDECDEVWAAVAYVTDDGPLIKECYKRKIPFKLWARYDYSVPVNVSVLRWFLEKSPLSICRLVADIHHAKVIWWKPYGVYIGSANLTQRAWGSNFEAGIFLREDEIDDYEMRDELEEFFQDIEDASRSLTEEVVKEMEDLQNDKRFTGIDSLRKEFDQKRLIPQQKSLLQVQRPAGAKERRRTEFLREWNDTLQIIRDIGKRVSKPGNRPSWIAEDVPNGVQADQFLHAYYYQKVKEGGRAQHREFHELNHRRCEVALREAIEWWANLDDAPTSERHTICESAPLIRKLLARDHLRSLSEDAMVSVLSGVHAFRNYADRTCYRTLGLADKLPEMKSEERGRYLARRLWKERNSFGENIIDLLNFLLYGGEETQLPQRLYTMTFEKERRLRFAGLSTFGEIVGWALPDSFPPRNGRTSKALFALGYNVKIHTE
jgi:hypothetical protein